MVGHDEEDLQVNMERIKEWRVFMNVWLPAISLRISCYSRPDVGNCLEVILAEVQSKSLEGDLLLKCSFLY